ncbi:hypothetical protein ncot_17345 [Nocardioides sp. JQ2195]|uniref:DUF5667 domain-containing protein n=1 Tax=Nocardioides sp. JQ2195 TaxID=2592334 RepID=UPI00143EBEAA|nr:DUF5667 domain-containing protein [Nocardioides sp. JQ2195]QIX28156.1 hypothetical protein ncot_17345 [Nocardioides sp. JQ2195]
MISLLPAQRRAEEFAELVEKDADQLSDDVRARHRDLLAAVSAMRSVEAPAPRPEFVTELRSQLMAEAEVALSQIDRKLALPTHPRSRRDRRLAIVGGIVALLGATTSVAVAAQGSLPGDTLYPVKRAIEGVQSSLSISEGARAETALEQASGRLAEVEALARQVDAENANQLPSTLDDFTDQAESGADLVLDHYGDDADIEPVNELRTFVSSSMAKLVSLDALLPAAATDSLNRAARVLSDINDRITSVCPDCGASVLEVPTRLVLALRTSDTGPLVSPTQAPAAEIPAGEPNQAIDPDEVVNLPENLVNDVTPPSPTSDGGTTTAPVDDAPVKKAKKAVDDLSKTVEKVTDPVLGDDGLVDGLLGLTDPLLGLGD